MQPFLYGVEMGVVLTLGPLLHTHEIRNRQFDGWKNVGGEM